MTTAKKVSAKKVPAAEVPAEEVPVEEVPAYVFSTATVPAALASRLVKIDPALRQIIDLCLPQIEAKVLRVAAIDAAAGKVAGTQAAKMKGFLAEVQAEGDLHVTTDGGTPHPVIVLRKVSADIARLQAEAAEAEAAINGLVEAKMRASSAHGSEVAALRVERDALVVSLTAMCEIARKPVAVPKAPRILGGKGVSTLASSSSSADATPKFGRYYIVEDGGRKFYGTGTLALLAFKFGVSQADLKVILDEAGVSSLTQVFEVTVKIEAKKPGQRKTVVVGQTNTVTIGLEVNASDVPEAIVLACDTPEAIAAEAAHDAEVAPLT